MVLMLTSASCKETLQQALTDNLIHHIAEVTKNENDWN